MRNISLGTVALLSLSLTSCASLPDTEINYYAAKSTAAITLTQHLTCDRTFTNLFQAANVTTTVTHSADIKDSYPIRISNFDSEFTSGSVSVVHFSDGRLNSINGSSTGQGMAIIQSAVAVAGAAFDLNFGDGPDPLSDGDTNVQDDQKQSQLIKEICNNINPRHSINPQLVDNVLMLTFTASHSGNSANPQFTPNTATRIRLKSLNKAIQRVYPNEKTAFLNPSINISSTNQSSEDNCLIKTKTKQGYSCDNYKKDKFAANDKKIRVQRSKNIKFEVTRSFNDQINNVIDVSQKKLTTTAQVAEKSFYYVPYKSENLFGTNMLGLTLSPMGTVMNISYNSTNGTSQALNSANSILGEFQGQTVQEAANEIAQTQRLIRCRAEPVSCQ